jgi:hypothetical protein
MNYVSIRNIFSYLTLPDDSWDDDIVLEFAYQAYETMTERKVHGYVQDVALLNVANHKAKLPKGFRLIGPVTYMLEQITNNLTTSDDDDLTPATDQTYKYNVDDLERIQHQGIVNNYNLYTGLFSSDWYVNNFVMMRPMNVPFTMQYNCDDCPNLNSTCDYVYSIDKFGNLTTNLLEGKICVTYMRDPVDDSGDTLVIDHPDVFNAMAAYVQMKLWEMRIFEDPRTGSSIYQMYLDKWEKLAAKVKGMLNIHNIDHISVPAYQQRYLQGIKNYSVFNQTSGMII